MEQILLGACQHLDFRPWNWGRRHRCCFQPLHFWYSLRPPSGVLQGVTLKTRTVCQTRLVVVSTGNLSGRDSQVYSRELMLREAATALQARSGWAHTAPQTRGPITAEVSLSPLEAGTSKIKAPADWVSGEACLLAHGHRPRVVQGERLVSGVFIRHYSHDCPSGSAGKESACNAGEPGWIPGSGRSPAEGNGKPLQYSCLGKSHGQKSLVGYSL